MSSNAQVPDYDLEDLRVVSSPRELRAMAHPLRAAILDLLLERAATVGELAAAVGRPARWHTTWGSSRTRTCSRWYAPGGSAPSTNGSTAAPRPSSTSASSARSRPACPPTILPRPPPSPGPRTRPTTCAPSSATPGSPGSAPRILGTRLPTHPRVHAAAALRRHCLRFVAGSIPPIPALPGQDTAPGRQAWTREDGYGKRHRCPFGKNGFVVLMGDAVTVEPVAGDRVAADQLPDFLLRQPGLRRRSSPRCPWKGGTPSPSAGSQSRT